MLFSENIEGRNKPRFLASRLTSSRWSEWEWRLAGVVVVFAYLAQDAIDLRWTWLDRLQTVDEFKYATGACLLLYVGWQWYLFLARQQGRKITLLLPLHQRSGVFAPVLFYVHSMQIGYGYLAVLSWVFLGNIVVGLVTPAGIKIRSRAYTFSWGVVHVMLAALTVILGFFHGYIALYYK